MEISVIEKLDNFFGNYKLLRFKKNQNIIHAEDPITEIFYLKKGLVRQLVNTENGEEITVNIFRPGSFFPIMVVLSGLENRYDFEALEDSSVYKATPQEVIKFLKQNPDVLLNLTQRFAKAIIGLSNRIEELTFAGADKKVVSLLIYLAQRFGEKKGEKILLKIKLTHKDIASWIGTTRETASRELEKLTNNKLISQKNHQIVINDLKSLKQLKGF